MILPSINNYASKITIIEQVIMDRYNNLYHYN